MPERLRARVTKDRAMGQLVVVAREKMEEKMTFMNADEISKAIGDSGKVVLYGIYSDNAKDSWRADSQATLQEIAKLLASNPALKIQVVGHTDNQGTPEHNLALTRRRAASVVRGLTFKPGRLASRVSSFGCGPYAPIGLMIRRMGRLRIVALN